jgi:SAM-dependent methyltransferase
MPQPPAELISRVANEPGDREKFLWMFRRYAALDSTEDVLDIGCGVGRAALALTEYLTGRYEGFDVDPELIGWCRENITSAHPNFGFTRVDVFNAAYNPTGIPGSELVFPYEDGSFNLAFGLSLFTHLLPEDFEHYLSETRRVLRPGGRTLFTFFLLRPFSRRLLAQGGYVADALLERDQGDFSTVYDKAEGFIAYRLGYVREVFERNGFEISEFFWGSWPQWAIEKRPDYTQDSVVARAI